MAFHVLAGIVGGFVATVVMSMLMMPMMKGQPMPTAIMASKFLNKKTPAQNKMLGMVLHFFYGIVAGLVFALIADALWGLGDETTGAIVGYALGWGVLLWLGSFMWMMILGMTKMMASMSGGQKMKMMGGQLMMHLVYGAVLGVIIGAWPA